MIPSIDVKCFFFVILSILSKCTHRTSIYWLMNDDRSGCWAIGTLIERLRYEIINVHQSVRVRWRERKKHTHSHLWNCYESHRELRFPIIYVIWDAIKVNEMYQVNCVCVMVLVSTKYREYCSSNSRKSLTTFEKCLWLERWSDTSFRLLLVNGINKCTEMNCFLWIIRSL